MIAPDIETLYAADGARFTLMFVGDDATVSVALSGAVVGRLFTRWLSMPDREGTRVLFLSNRGDDGAAEAVAEGRDGSDGALGGVEVRAVTPHGHFQVELSGRLGTDHLDLDAPAQGNPDGWAAEREEGQAGQRPVGQVDGHDDVAVGHGHVGSPDGVDDVYRDLDRLKGEILAFAETAQRLAEVFDGPVDTPEVIGRLIRLDLECRPADGAVQLWAGAQLSEAALGLLAALRAGNANLGVIEEALGHLMSPGSGASLERVEGLS